MKRQLLFASLAVLTTAVNVVQAQDPGDRDKVIYSTNLSLEWYGAPTGECLNAGGGAGRHLEIHGHIPHGNNGMFALPKSPFQQRNGLFSL